MKKLILLLLFIPLDGLAQTMDTWQYEESVDEFGDPTGQALWVFKTKGTMSNSATTGSDAYLIVSESEGNLRFEILEYDGNNPATFLCEQVDFAVKTPDGKVHRETKYMRQNISKTAIPVYRGEYEYGTDELYFPAPNERVKKVIQRWIKKGRYDLGFLFRTSRDELKLVITCGGSKYNFKYQGFLSKEEIPVLR